MTDGSANLTDKEHKSLAVLEHLGSATIREWAEAQQTGEFGSERTSDDELRARAERLEAKGQVEQYVGPEGQVLYRPAK